MNLLALLLAGAAFADTDTFTTTATATRTATATATATVTNTPPPTPTPPFEPAAFPYGQTHALNNLQRLLECDREDCYVAGVSQWVQANETPAAYWTPGPRRAFCLTNPDPAWWVGWNTGPFDAGKGDPVYPFDKQCLVRFTGASSAIWLCTPAGAGTRWVVLWAQPAD